MSWYINKNSDFIDAIQEYPINSSNIANVNNGGSGGGSIDLGYNSTISDFLELKFEENIFNLYLKSIYPNTKIFFKTNDDDIKVKIEDGKLYVYYDYNAVISLIIPSGWTNVSEYLISLRQGVNNNSAGIVGVGTAITAVELDINTTIRPAIIEIEVIIGNHETRILNLEAFNADIADYNTQNNLDNFDNMQTLNETIKELKNSYFNNLQSYTVINSLRTFFSTRIGILMSIAAAIAFGGLVSGGVAVVGFLVDLFKQKELDEDIQILNKIKINVDNQADKDVKDKLEIEGLIIDPIYNLGDLTDGIYTIIHNNPNGDNSKIILNVVNGFAEIKEILEVGNGYNIGDIITINKNTIGGTSGDLIINVVNVYSSVEILEKLIKNKYNEITDLNNRQRRRQAIPNKNDFNNGFSITETTETQESGEELPSLSIALKLDTSQFEYDNSGNLQLITYFVLL